MKLTCAKRLLAAVLAGALCLSLLAGCLSRFLCLLTGKPVCFFFFLKSLLTGKFFFLLLLS